MATGNAETMTEYSPSQLARLFDAILVNDVVDAQVDLPPSVTLDHPAGHLADGFAISAQLWREGFDRTALLEFIDRLGKGKPPAADEQLWFKHVRAKFKHLRFAFVLYGADHICPRIFKSMTTSMGLLQDGFRNDRPGAIRRQSAVLRLILTRPMQVSLRREIDRVALDSALGFRSFTLAQIGELRRTLAKPALNGHGFHAARKIVSRQVSFHDDMRTIHPTDEHVAMSRYLSAINGMMGQYHDELVSRDGRGEIDYGQDTFALPESIRIRLETLVSRYP